MIKLLLEMSSKNLQKKVSDILLPADIKINGRNPWDITIHNDKFYKKVLRQGTLGLGESYMDGWWDCEALDEFISKALRADLYNHVKVDWKVMWEMLLDKVVNMQVKSKATRNARHHYDIGNNLYQIMLDKRLNYSCGYWKFANNLDEAQVNKLDLICRKIKLQKGQRVLDIGCGWGGFAKFAAEEYGAEVVGVTVSKKQAELAREICKGLLVEIRLQDYRDVNESFDHIVSIGMVEHVGYRNYSKFMQVAARCLKDDGLFLLHTIGHPFSKTSSDPFSNTYLFPNSLLPSVKQLAAAAEHIFLIEDLHNFGADYDLTLMAWFKNFNDNWDKLKNQYDERFYRMWKYYLLTYAGGFRSRNNQLWQIVFSKKGVLRGYQSVR